MKDEMTYAKFVKIGLGVILLAAILALAGCPQYKVYKRGLDGKAELAQADYNRKIRIREAEAAKESASLLAEAEVIRARGVKEANQIIAEGLGGPEGYLRYLYIQTLETTDKQIIYVPTEAGLPILEAGKRK